MCYEIDPPAAAPAALDMEMCYEIDPPAVAPAPKAPPKAPPMAPPAAAPKAPRVTAPPSSKPDAPKKNGWRHAPTWIMNPFSESCCAECTTPAPGADPKSDGGPTERTELLKGKNDRVSADADDPSAAKEGAPLWITVLSSTIKLVAWLAHGCMDGATLGAGRSGWPVLIGIAFPATFCATMGAAQSTPGPELDPFALLSACVCWVRVCLRPLRFCSALCDGLSHATPLAKLTRDPTDTPLYNHAVPHVDHLPHASARPQYTLTTHDTCACACGSVWQTSRRSFWLCEPPASKTPASSQRECSPTRARSQQAPR